MVKYVGDFEGVKIYESSYFNDGKGISIPELGIFIGKGVFSKNADPWLIKHEFGHMLQKRNNGFIKFYTQIAFISLWSATKQMMTKNYRHHLHPVEISANQLAYRYFDQPDDWPFKRFPIKY